MPAQLRASSRPGDDARSDRTWLTDSSGAGVDLSRMERWTLDTVRRRGTHGFVITITAAVAVASFTLAVLGVGAIASSGAADVMVPTMVLSLAIPAIVAPPALYMAVQLTARLDEAGKMLKKAAVTDPLTGVLNRRGFFEAVEAFTQSARAVDVAMVDVDKFKVLNDRLGHAAGDVILQSVADWLTEVAGDEGIVARMGGDEFAMVVPATGGWNLPARKGLVSVDIPFSVTIGSSGLFVDGDVEAALIRADADLYRVKAR